MKVFKTISVFTLALLVLISSSSFVVGIHLCAGEVKNMSLFTKADGCEKEKNLPPCHKDMSAPCCDDATILHEGEGFKAADASVVVSPLTSVDIESSHFVLAEVVPSITIKNSSLPIYDPPLRSRNRIIDLQVFNI